MSPEMQKGQKYNGKKVDMFSLGVILWAIVNGNMPFNDASLSDPHYKILVNSTPETYFQKVGGDKYSEEFKDLIRLMLSYFPKDRPTIENLRKHPWIKK